MGARTRKIRHDENTRMKIKVAQIINRLHNHLMAKAPILDASQVSAAKVLLGKVLPDLANTTLTGADGGPLQHSVIEQRIVDPKS